MNNKETNLKEKLKQALEATARVISDDFKVKDKLLDYRKNQVIKVANMKLEDV